MLYSDIVGQEAAKKRLIGLKQSERIPHALMFTGRSSMGTLPMAIAFAQHVFCTAATSSGACNVCSACKMVAGLAHPDLHLVFPVAKVEKGRSASEMLPDFREKFLTEPYMSLNDWFSSIGADNKQPLINVAQAAEILQKLSITSYSGSYKVMIIWMPEKMNTEAANKLLKILEEPTEQTLFILVSEQPDQLLATIISRVQVVPFYPDTDEVIAAALVEEFACTEEEANSLALLAGGAYGEAIKLQIDAAGADSQLQSFQEFMRLALRFDGSKAMQWIDKLAAAGRERQKQFMLYALEVFREALMYNFGNRDLLRMKSAERSFLEKFAPFINQRNYERLVEEFNSNFYYIERNANAKILLMDLLLKSNELINLK